MSVGGPSGKPIPAKLTVEDLGIDVEALEWQRSAGGASSIEIAFVGVKPGPDTPPGTGSPSGTGTSSGTGTPSSPGISSGAGNDDGEWVLMRVADDPAQRVLVYDRFEWECFLDGAKNGEFDDAQ